MHALIMCIAAYLWLICYFSAVLSYVILFYRKCMFKLRQSKLVSSQDKTDIKPGVQESDM